MRVSFGSILPAILAVFILAGPQARAQYTASDTLEAVAPGLVYKEFSRTITGNNIWRVTDPDAPFVGDPDNSPSTFLPNPVLNLTVSDLQGAIRAVAVIDVWGGHVGTVGKEFRLNGNGWIGVPDITGTPTDPECYIHQVSLEVEVPLEDLVEGVNTLEGTSDGQTCYNFGWGQWGWYAFHLRVFYDPAQKANPTGSITSPVDGATIGEDARFAVDASGAAGISRVEFVGRYEDFDVDGDGVYTDWQQSYHVHKSDSEVTIRNHMGTAESAPYEIAWDNAWVPEQAPGSVDVVARIRGGDGLWYVTDRVTGLTLDRPGTSVHLYRAENVGEKYWVRNGQTLDNDFTIPAGHDLADADAARMLVASWNGINGHAEPGEIHWTKVNGWTTPDFGENHFYSFDVIDVPVGELQSGTNTITFYSESTHHGAEVHWPGPGIVVRYVDFSDVPATIISEPEDVYAVDGGTATFEVTAVGADPLTYQWQRNGVDIPGANAAQYTTPPVSGADDGSLYRCVVSNGLGGDASGEALLTVLVPGPRSTSGQLVLYDFEEGGGATVHDVSGSGAPLDLTIGDPGAVTWLGGALSVDASTVVASAGAASKIHDAVAASNEITIEAWLKPGNLTQNGPARMVTLSPDTGERNVMLGQGVHGAASDVVEVRLRTTTTDLNGKPALATPDGTLSTDLTHVVFTRDAPGVTRIYLDGVQQAVSLAAGDLSNWDPGYGLTLANEGTGDRPWLGELHLVAIFDRALPFVDVLQNYASGPTPPAAGEINVDVSTAQTLDGPVYLNVLPGGGDPLTTGQSWSGVPGEAPTPVDATIVVRLTDEGGQPVEGFPAESIGVASQLGGWTQCGGTPLTADGPTDANGETTISGTLHGGGFGAPGELLQVIVDDPALNATTYPGGLAGLEYFVNSADIDGDLDVDLSDVADFSQIFYGAYDPAADFVWDGVVNLPDVGRLGVAIGDACPGVAVAKSRAETPRAEGALGVVLGEGGAANTLSADPGARMWATVVLRGPVAERGVEAFDLRVRTTPNVIVHQRELAGQGIGIPAGDGFVAGYPESRRAQKGEALALLRLEVSVTDDRPARFWLETRPGSGSDLPLVSTGEKTLGVLPASGDPSEPVAALNDVDFALDGESPLPRMLSLAVAPNPFNPMTRLKFGLPVSSGVDLRVYDARGKLVAVLARGTMEAGEHEVVWDGRDEQGRGVASGVYFSKLEAGGEVRLEKMMLVR